MTRFEQIVAAFPLHAQRIAEAAGPKWLSRSRNHISRDSAGVELQCAFTWALTEEGHDYWSALAKGAM